MQTVNQEIDDILGPNLEDELEREWFILLPHAVSREVMAAWLRHHHLRDFDRGTIERLTVAAKTAPSGKAIDAVKGHRMHVGGLSLALKHHER
jgi:hypothetical protein